MRKMNNPLQMAQLIKNPQMILQQAMQSANPIVKNAIQMYQRGDSNGINELVNNLCREKGVKPEDVLNQVKRQLGM